MGLPFKREAGHPAEESAGYFYPDVGMGLRGWHWAAMLQQDGVVRANAVSRAVSADRSAPFPSESETSDLGV